MATTNMNIRTDVEVKAAAEQLFNELGLNLYCCQYISPSGYPYRRDSF